MPDDPPTPRRSSGSATARTSSSCKLIDEHGVEAYEGSVRYVAPAIDAGTAARGRLVEHELPGGARGRRHRGPVRGAIDGHVAAEEDLRGKPAPDTFLAGARALGVEPAEAAVFEDALAGVEAGRAGEFGCVVGVDRVGQADALRDARRRRRRRAISRSCSD